MYSTSFRELTKMPNSQSNSVMEVTLGSVVKTLLQNSCYRDQQPKSSQKSSGTWEDFCYQVEVEVESRLYNYQLLIFLSLCRGNA